MTAENGALVAAAVPEKVPGRTHYSARYLGQDLVRLCSYREQIKFALRSDPRNVLVVGKGDGIVQDILKRIGIQVTTLDIQPELQPDVVGSVDAIPLPAKSYDVALCCQVLEHLPFDRLLPAMKELARVSRQRLVISLPDVRRFISLRIQLARFSVDWQISLPRFRAPQIPQERFNEHGHYWEIGFRGSAFRDMCRAIATAGCHIIETRRVSDLPWHTFIYASPQDGERLPKENP